MRIYEEFRAYYEKTHAASVPVLEEVISEYPGWLRYAVGAMFVSAALLSGVHTISTVRAGIPDDGIISKEFADLVAQGSFIAIELALFVGAYALIGARRWRAAAMLVLAGGVAMAANVLSVNEAFSQTSDDGRRLVAFILGVGAPLIAMVSGEMFVSMYSADREATRLAKEVYRKAMIAFDAEVLEAWKTYQRKHRLLDVSTESSAEAVHLTVSNPSNGLSIGQNEVKSLPTVSTLGHTKQPNASETVRHHLEQNPQDVNADARELGALLGVGKSTVNNVQRRFKQGEFSTNGHGVGQE